MDHHENQPTQSDEPVADAFPEAASHQSPYSSFLRLLNESDFLAHLHLLGSHETGSAAPRTQGFLQPKQPNDSPGLLHGRVLDQGLSEISARPVVSPFRAGELGPNQRDNLAGIAASTPLKAPANAALVSAASLASDPFDDNLDSALLKLAPPKMPSMLSEESAAVPGNQLVLVNSALKPSSQTVDEGPLESKGPPRVLDDRPQDEDDLDALLSDDPDVSYADVGPQHQFGDYDTYFQNKYKKQQVADRDYIHWEKQRRVANGQLADIPRIFAGCKIFVNGNTSPTLPVIHKLVILHGGIFLSHLLNKGAATHIICDRLTPRKRIQFKNYKVVRAKWISDCVEKETLLDWKQYRLIDDVEPLQKLLGFEKIGEVGSREHGVSEQGLEFDNDDGNAAGEESMTGEARHEDGRLEEVLADDLAAGDFEVERDDGRLQPKLDLEILQTGKEINNLDTEVYEQLSDSNSLEDPAESPPNPPPPKVDPKRVFEQNADLSGSESEFREEPEALAALEEAQDDSNLSQLKVSKPRQLYAQMDAKHPEFLKHFFANSRLHHLSTWKADLKSKFVRLVALGGLPGPKNPSAEPVIMHVDFDCFFAAASALRHPELKLDKDPIAVSHGGKSSDVASCNYVARKFGVSNGMWLGRAKERCPDLHVVDYDFEAYEKFSHAFYTYLISKKIFDSIFPVLIDEVLVDATSFCDSEDVFGAVENLCADIRHDILQITGCSVSIGASKNVMLAKMANRKAKPNGHFYLHENIQEFLDEASFSDLPGIGWGLSLKLAEQLNLDAPREIKIGQVRELTLRRLSNIFGEKLGPKIYDNCRGRDSTSIKLDLSSSEVLLGRKTVSVDVNYGIRFDTFVQAETFLMSLARELHSRLIDLGACGSAITLKLARRAADAPVNPPKFMGLGKCNFFSRSSSLGVATNDWGILGSEMRALFRTLNIPPQELRGIAVSLTKLEDIESVKKQRQQKLVFTANPARNRPKLANSSQDFPFAERISTGDSVDWAVFNQLPDDIRHELKKELLRRGIRVSGNEVSPSKKAGGGKAYMQQLFPTQPNGEFKMKRVMESPTKKKRKLNESPKKRASESREASPTPYNDTVSYDEAVLAEIPSSIRNEFMEELEWQKKHKLLGFVSMRTKLEQRQAMENTIKESVIDQKWLDVQDGLEVDFNGAKISAHDLRSQLQEWVAFSVQDGGPHPMDAEMIQEHLTTLVNRGKITRAVVLLDAADAELRTQQSILSMCGSLPDKEEVMKCGLADCRRWLVQIRAGVVDACAKKNVFL